METPEKCVWNLPKFNKYTKTIFDIVLVSLLSSLKQILHIFLIFPLSTLNN